MFVVVRLFRVLRRIELGMAMVPSRVVTMGVSLVHGLLSGAAGVGIGMRVLVRMGVLVRMRVRVRVHEVAMPMLVLVLVRVLVHMVVDVLVRLSRLDRREAVAGFGRIAHADSLVMATRIS